MCGMNSSQFGRALFNSALEASHLLRTDSPLCLNRVTTGPEGPPPGTCWSRSPVPGTCRPISRPSTPPDLVRDFFPVSRRAAIKREVSYTLFPAMEVLVERSPSFENRVFLSLCLTPLYVRCNYYLFRCPFCCAHLLPCLTAKFTRNWYPFPPF